MFALPSYIDCGIPVGIQNSTVHAIESTILASTFLLARRKFTPADFVALATSLSGCSETTEVDAHRLLTRDDRTAVVDSFFGNLWNQVANATVNCYI